MRAYGVHVFAGGFTLGVRQVASVAGQWERHPLGEGTSEANGVARFYIDEERARLHDCEVCYGNPRCSGFSMTTVGCAARGPNAPQNIDIVELCRLATSVKTPIIIWESVQGAYTTGRPLIRRLIREFFDGYRIAHVFESAACFGNSQHRKRYLFVAYRDGLHFNFAAPAMQRRATIGEALAPFLRVESKGLRLWTGRVTDYCQTDHATIGEHKAKVSVPWLRQGESLCDLARRDPTRLSEFHDRKWKAQLSSLPFGMHCMRRLSWDEGSPTLTSACTRSLIHPLYDRPLMVCEFAAIMGWPQDAVVAGPLPFAQLAKGVVPDVGEWIATQALHCLTGAWGSDDWESTWDGEQWVGTADSSHKREKVFNMTRYFKEVHNEHVPVS